MKANTVFVFSLLLVSASHGAATLSEQTHKAVETEMFSIPISPNMFNWTYQEFDQQYRFHASLLGKPELPPWLRYIYSGRHHSGFIYGTPPRGSKSPIILEVIGLNREDYETRRLLLTLRVRRKAAPALARREVELKIDNLNVEDLLDEHRMSRLKEIFRSKLWPESGADLACSFLASAVDLGARLPLRPNEGEGLVVRLGSTAEFSTELRRLREEVRPLARRGGRAGGGGRGAGSAGGAGSGGCPRDFKRTTVERLFRDHSLTLDWCSFELYNTIYKERSTQHVEYLSELPDPGHRRADLQRISDRGVWAAPARCEVPSRGYGRLAAAAAAAPACLLLAAAAVLTAVLCVHYAGIAHKDGTGEQSRFEADNTEQTQVHDNPSSKSLGASPNNSLTRPYSPKSTSNLAGSYNRPQPPPYIGSTSNSLHHRKSGNTETIDSRTLALEESLQLLNEAKIGADFDISDKNPIVDINDGSEDYVPIKGDFLNADLDDINVPELSKYGLGVSVPNI